MEPARTRTEMEEALRKEGCRITSQRKAILEYLASTNVHPSASQVFEEVGKTHPGLSRATVYNTLQVLARNGLIKVLEFRADNRYETNLSFHINLICTSCGRIQDLEKGTPMSPEEVGEKVGFEVKSYRMEYYGLCPACRARTDGSQASSAPSRRTPHRQKEV